ncbi:Importin subunit beta-1 [Sesamum angolense]|uniref:Importin subunit beta-1 n=1 Tax=Sesamum angolense TaxID=2727404 RepID=A0AAE1WMP1_9LAMI|nr:Importin subunit beta-1 [Sesamum angolense]
MPRIFELTSNAVKGDEEAVALQAVEFWSSICDEELEIQDYEVPESGDSSAPHSQFIQKALPTLVPMLLETLLKQDEEQDQEDGIWNLAMAGGTCLGLVARTVGDSIVPLVMPFVEINISKTDWRSREAATYAFGSILEGPSIEKLSPMVNAGLEFLLNAMHDENSHVKDTTAWTLSRIFELLHSPATGFSVITLLTFKGSWCLVGEHKRFSTCGREGCGAIYFLAQGYEDAGPSSSLLTPYLPDILNSLIITAERTDGSDSKLRSSAYETLNEGKARRFASLSCEAMLAIGALAYAVGPEFGKYMQEFYKYLEMGCRILRNISGELHRSVKPPIFSCFGDIALAIVNTLKFLELVAKDKAEG